MPVKFRFDADFDYRVGPNVDIAYKAGMILLIPEAHAKAAERAGRGERVDRETKLNVRRKA